MTPSTITTQPAAPEITEKAKVEGKVVHLLDQLGNTIQDWRASLSKKNVVGIMGDSQSCVLANYIRGNLGDEYSVEVSGGSVEVMWFGKSPDGSLSTHGHYCEVTMEKEQEKIVDRFVSAFDNNRFPELVDPRGDS